MKQVSKLALAIAIMCGSTLVYATERFGEVVPDECESVLSIYNDVAAAADEKGLGQLAGEASRARAEFIATVKQKSGEDRLNYCRSSSSNALVLEKKLDDALAAKK